MTDKISFSEKIAGNLTDIINNLIENFQSLLKEELDKIFEKNHSELAQLSEKYESLNENLKGLIEAQNNIKIKVEELYNTSDNTFKRIQSEFTERMSAYFKEFHEEMEKIIDMNAALTVELSNRLDEMLVKLNSLSTIGDKQQEMLSELDKMRSQVEKTSTIFESRLDGLKKQIEDNILPEISLIQKIQEKLNQLNTMISELNIKLTSLNDTSKHVSEPAADR